MGSKIPTWFKQAGIYSPLPKIFTCGELDISKHNLVEKYNHTSDVTISFDLKRLGLSFTPKWLYYWCSKKRNLNDTSYGSPIQAYGDFSNSGLIDLNNKDRIEICVDNPVPYKVNGVHFPPHIHFTVLKPNNIWSIKPWAIDVYPNINTQQFLEMYQCNPRKCIILNAMDKIYEGKKTPTIKNTKRIPYSTQNLKIENKIISYIRKYKRNSMLKQNIKNGMLEKHIPIVVYCAHSKCKASHILAEKLIDLGFVNILYYTDGYQGFINHVKN
jgi:hypothetical protein